MQLVEALVPRPRVADRSVVTGTDAPVGLTLRGTGDAVVPLTGRGTMVVGVTANGAHGVLVDVVDQAGQVAEMLINEEGGYTGSHLVGPAGYVPGSLRITTQGNWSLTLLPASQAPTLEVGTAVRGRGDRVLRLAGRGSAQHPGDGVTVRVRASGGHVLVVARDEAGQRYELLVNELGGFHGLIRVPAGCSLLEVSTPGGCVLEAL